MKKWDRKYSLVVLAFLLVFDALFLLWADMMNWNLLAFARECGIVAFCMIMVFKVDYRKAIGLALCLVDLIVFVIKSQLGGRGPLWLIPNLLLVLYFFWCFAELTLKRRKLRFQPDIPGNSSIELEGKSNG
ncbi:MAG: hypothetical protein ABSB60_04910 [Terracidiphilus sp.]|jgi:hypothetical protein